MPDARERRMATLGSMLGSPFGRLLDFRFPDGPRASQPDSLDYYWHMEARKPCCLPLQISTAGRALSTRLLQLLKSPLRVESARKADLIFVPIYARALAVLANELKKPNKHAPSSLCFAQVWRSCGADVHAAGLIWRYRISSQRRIGTCLSWARSRTSSCWRPR